MSLEREQYERGWDVCRKCGCRRPEAELKRIDNWWECRDEAWCDRTAAERRRRSPPPPKPRKK